MTDRFVRSLAGGAGTGVDWANAFTTITLAIAAAAAGDRYWVADDHAESTAGAVSLAFKGTLAAPDFVYCVDHTVASPGTGDVKTTGTVTSTGANNLTITGTGLYIYGLAFSAASGANANALVCSPNSTGYIIFDTCKLIKASTNSNVSSIVLGNAAAVGTASTLKNTTVQFGNTGDLIAPWQEVQWLNTASAIAGATIPTSLFSMHTGTVLQIDGVDLSAIAGGTIVPASTVECRVNINYCKIGGSTVIAAQPTGPGPRIDAILTDSAAANYRQTRIRYMGTLTQETTIVRSGGASDGTTPLSWKIVSTANARWTLPFECFPIAIWNDTVGSPVTATVEIAASAGLNNDDVWMEVEYLGSSSTPQSSFANSTKANNLATGTALTASSAAWASSPGSPQKMAVTFTPQMKGYVYVRIYVGKASQTVYVDPEVTLS